MIKRFGLLSMLSWNLQDKSKPFALSACLAVALIVTASPSPLANATQQAIDQNATLQAPGLSISTTSSQALPTIDSSPIPMGLEQAERSLPQSLNELHLHASLFGLADSILAMRKDVTGEPRSEQSLSTIARIASTCMALYASELRFYADKKSVQYQSLSTRDRRKMLDDSDRFVSGFVIVSMVIAAQTIGASAQSLDQMQVATQLNAQALINKTALGLKQIRPNSTSRNDIYSARLDECQSIANSEHSKYNEIFRGILY